MIDNAYPGKRRFSVTIDAHLADRIDQLTQNRSQAVEEGLRLWYAKQIEDQIRTFYQVRDQVDVDFEQEWVRRTQPQALAAWEEAPWDLSRD
ncbi:MAG: hypothetical protein H7Y22_02590 [Gemmatimonadaceae bacterium]|nr:hypothetical protein [Gloeobacterales cyanobacterium ES-bin-141]